MYPGCGNTMPTCPTWSHFIQDKLKIFIYCPSTSTNVNKILTVFHILINYYEFSNLALKTVWILISCLYQKPADLDDLHCLQEKPAQDPYGLWFHSHTVFKRVNC